MAIRTTIFKGNTRVLFGAGQDEALDVLPSDMGEGQVTLTFDSDASTRLPTAIGTIPSAQIAMQATITIEIMKITTCYQNWVKRIVNNSILNGEITIIDDTKDTYTIIGASITKQGDTKGDGTTASVTFTIQGNYYINQELSIIAGV